MDFLNLRGFLFSFILSTKPDITCFFLARVCSFFHFSYRSKQSNPWPNHSDFISLFYPFNFPNYKIPVSDLQGFVLIYLFLWCTKSHLLRHLSYLNFFNAMMNQQCLFECLIFMNNYQFYQQEAWLHTLVILKYCVHCFALHYQNFIPYSQIVSFY